MSEQECVYSLLELPITQSSIKVEFINTSEIPNCVFIAKADYLLKKMDPEDDNINNLIALTNMQIVQTIDRYVFS